MSTVIIYIIYYEFKSTSTHIRTRMEGLFAPGTRYTAFAIFNATVLALLGFVVYLFYRGIANIHVLILSFLAIGLLASVNLLVFSVGLGGNTQGTEEPKVVSSSSNKQGNKKNI